MLRGTTLLIRALKDMRISQIGTASMDAYAFGCDNGAAPVEPTEMVYRTVLP